ncbi:hypothetical protein M569_07826, partial [Genlisea aurea]
ALISLLHHQASGNSSSGSKKARSRGGGGGAAGGLFRMFKLVPMLSTGCKVVALLSGRNRRPLITDSASTGTLFGYRKGRLTLAIQEDPHRLPSFVIELPILTSFLHREMASDVLRIALETDTKTQKKKLLEEFVWAVYCNGRKMGYSIRRLNMTDDEVHVMRLLRGISMGAGVLPPPPSEKQSPDGEMTYVRARFDRVSGSKNSESFYMLNPDGASGQELSIFFLRVH